MSDRIEQSMAEHIAHDLHDLARWHRRELTSATVRAYVLGLQDCTLDEIDFAFGLARDRCREMPTPAQLRELAEQRAAYARKRLRRGPCFLCGESHDGLCSKERQDPPSEALAELQRMWGYVKHGEMK